MNKLKYLGYSIVFQEVPDEVTLAINISGCPHKCEGCHSKYLWEYEGNYISDDLYGLIKKYEGLITCVCFMGGEQNPLDLCYCLYIVHQLGLKTCLYSGVDKLHYLTAIGVSHLCDYIKVGHYDKQFGGLDSPTTNQRFFSRIDDNLIDTTYKFQKGHYNDSN